MHQLKLCFLVNDVLDKLKSENHKTTTSVYVKENDDDDTRRSAQFSN